MEYIYCYRFCRPMHRYLYSSLLPLTTATLHSLPFSCVLPTHEIDRETHWLSGTASWAPKRRISDGGEKGRREVGREGGREGGRLIYIYTVACCEAREERGRRKGGREERESVIALCVGMDLSGYINILQIPKVQCTCVYMYMYMYMQSTTGVRVFNGPVCITSLRHHVHIPITTAPPHTPTHY